MPDFKPFIVIGLALGGVYAMSGVGLVVLFRTTGVLNLAYGAVGALGSLVAFTMIDHGQNEWVAYGVALLLGGVLTLAYGWFFGPPLANRDPLVKASATLGFALILLGFMQWRWTADVRSLSLPTSDWQYTNGWLRINWTQGIGIIFPIVVTVGTVAFLKRTKVGTAMRALADERDNTALLGVPVRRVEASAWFVSGVLFGFSGIMLASLVSMEIAALTFSIPIAALAAALIGKVAVVVGHDARRVRDRPRAGRAERVQQPRRLPEHDPVRLCHHRAVVVRLAPAGGRTGCIVTDLASTTPSTPAASGTSAADSVDTRLPSMVSAITPQRIGALTVALAFLLFFLPWILTSFWLQVTLQAVIYSAVTLGLGLLVGRVGMYSLCQVVFVVVGAWVSLRLAQEWSLPFPVLLIVTGIITGVFGAIIGIPALRLSGLYLALVTLMAAGAITLLLKVVKFPNGGGGFWGFDKGKPSGSASLDRPAIALGDIAYFRYSVIVVALMFLLVTWHIKGKPGRAWASIRQSQVTAVAAGVDTTLYKLWAFALSASITGVAGALLAAGPGGVTVNQFPVEASILLLAVVLMGGVYSIWGAVVAAFLLRILPRLLEQKIGLSTELLTILFGVGVMQVLLTAPGGIIADLGRLGAAIARKVKRSPTEPRLVGSDTMIEITGLTVRFGGVTSLDDLTITMDAGTNGLIGPNGAGKTTFFNVLSGFVRPQQRHGDRIRRRPPGDARLQTRALGGAPYVPDRAGHRQPVGLRERAPGRGTLRSQLDLAAIRRHRCRGVRRPGPQAPPPGRHARRRRTPTRRGGPRRGRAPPSRAARRACRRPAGRRDGRARRDHPADPRSNRSDGRAGRPRHGTGRGDVRSSRRARLRQDDRRRADQGGARRSAGRACVPR